jgi:CubicO group peptidase (beta-lactamase class C family)
VLRHLGESPPGEHSYSNSGYILLGLVIEAVAGESYYDYVQRRILVPAGMTSTGFPRRSQRPADEALPYAPQMDAGAVVPGAYLPVVLGERGTSAGGASTTADDLLRFVDALRDGRLLDERHFSLLTRPHVAMTPSGSQSYGYGTIVEQGPGGPSWGHGGTARGTQFELRVYPQLDAALLVLSNYGTIGPVELASTLDHLLRNSAP